MVGILYAAVCIENGFNTKTVSKLFGHASVNITLNCYLLVGAGFAKVYVACFNVLHHNFNKLCIDFT